MNFDHDVGSIELLSIDTTVSPPAGGTVGTLSLIGTGALKLQVGTTAQRPTGANGWTRGNTDLNQIEGYINGAWAPMTQNAELQALAALSSTGMLSRTGSGTYAVRTISATAGHGSFANGDGVGGAPVFSLANVGSAVTGQFVKITTDAQGRVSATTAVVAGDITALVDATYVNVAGDSMSSAANLVFSGGGTVQGLPIPTNSTDAATKAYVDGLAQGLDTKASVRVATTVAGTLASSFANGQVVDTITLVTGDRILIKNQAAPAENGIYTVNASGAPTRATDFDSWIEIPNGYVFAEDGTANADTGWVCTSNAGGTLNTTAITWVQFAGAGTYTSGAGITITGTSIAITAPVSIALGGTNNASLGVSNGGIVWSDSSKLNVLAGVAAANRLLLSGNSATPAWSSATFPASTAAGKLLYSSAANTIAELSLGSANQVLGMNAAATLPEYKTVTQGTGITVTHGVASTATALQLVKENPSSPTVPVAGGTNAVVIGSGANATANSSLGIGDGSDTRVVGMIAGANGKFATAGDAQEGNYILRALTSNATPAEMFIDGSAIRLALANNSCYTFSILVTARRTDTTGGGAGYRFDGVIRRDATAGTTTLVGTPAKQVLGETNSAWDVVLSADTTNGSIKLMVTGEAAKTIRWVANVTTAEVTN